LLFNFPPYLSHPFALSFLIAKAVSDISEFLEAYSNCLAILPLIEATFPSKLAFVLSIPFKSDLETSKVTFSPPKSTVILPDFIAASPNPYYIGEFPSNP